MADTDTGPELPPVMTPRAQAALAGGDDPLNADTERAEYYRTQRKAMEEGVKRERELSEAQEKELAPMRADYMRSEKEFANLSREQTNRLLRSRQDIPKFDRQAAQGDILNMVAIASTFGALAGGLARNHMTAAMTAFSGTLRGFAKGQITAFEQNYQAWRANTDRALEYNQRMVDEYRAILGNAKLDLDVKGNLLQMTANKWQDQIGANAAQLRDIERMTQLVEAQDRANETLVLRRDAMGQLHDDKMKEIDAKLALKGLKRDENNNIVRDPNAATTGQTWQRQAFEDWRNEYIQTEGHPPSAEEERQFGQTLTTVRSAPAMALQKYLQENPKATSQDVVAFAATMAGDIAAIRAAGNRAGQIAVSAEEADSTFTLAKQASSGFPRGTYQPLNRLYQDAALVKSDKRYRTFMAANEAAVTAYGATMSRSGANTVSAQTRAHEVLDTADSDEAYKAGIEQLQKEVNEVRKAPARARAALMRSLGLVVDQPDKTDEPPAKTSDTTSLSNEELLAKLRKIGSP